MDILLIEDNPGDARLLEEAFVECGLDHRLAVVTDGVEAMRYLRREKPYPRGFRPDLILLDLNLPRKDGREVLMEIKTDAALRRIPVVVLRQLARIGLHHWQRVMGDSGTALFHGYPKVGDNLTEDLQRVSP